MKLLIDAQLPRRMAAWFADAGFDAVHTLDLPRGNRTPDLLVLSVSEREERILVTKDADFVNEHILRGRPKKLLLISTGNLSNRELEALFLRALPDLTKAFETNSFIEVGRSGVITRG